MAERLDRLTSRVTALYDEERPGRADWADWLSKNHIGPVSEAAARVARRMGANAELAAAGGLLHDIADSVMSRFDSAHEETSLQLARDIMRECGYTEDEIGTVVDDGIRLHSCRDGMQPTTLVGKCIASGDALAHLQTDFYDFAKLKMEKEGRPIDIVKKWAVSKLHRDYHDKLCFDELKPEVRSDFERQLAKFQ